MERTTIIPLRGAAGPAQVARAIVEKLPGKFWSVPESGHLLVLDENTGELSLVSNIVLQEIIEANFNTPRLVRAADGRAKAEYASLILSKQVLTDIMSQLTTLYAAPAPTWAAPARPVTASLRNSIIGRLDQGESRQSIARAYSVSEAQVLAVARAQ